MGKSAVVFLVPVFALLLGACGGDTGEASSEQAPITTASASTTAAAAATTATTATTTTTEPKPEGLADGDYTVEGYFTVIDVGDPPDDMAGTPVLKPYENWTFEGEDVLEDEVWLRGTVSCDLGECIFDLGNLGTSGLAGWRFTPGRTGGTGFYVNPENPSDSEALIVESPQPLVLTDSGFETSFVGTATCGDETSEIMVSLVFDAEDLLGEANIYGILRAKLSGALNVDVERWGREEGDGWAVCWLPSVTFEEREPPSES